MGSMDIGFIYYYGVNMLGPIEGFQFSSTAVISRLVVG
jgi:hypothetical protein